MSHHRQILLRDLVASHKDFLLGQNSTSPPGPLCSHSALFAVSLLPDIPRATAIAPELEATGLKPAIARQISDAYLKSADHLRQICQTSLQNACAQASAKGHLSQEEAQVMAEAWAAAYAQQTRCWAESALSRARDVVATFQTVSAACSTNEKKLVFNYEYTPLLEKYFQHNAYPSAPDRAVLARKSMMTPRQIEVWFQNHRNRAKKEGKVLRKLADEPLSSEFSLRSLEEKMPHFIIPTDERKPLKKSGLAGDDLSDMEQAQPATPLSVSSFTIESNPLNPPRPPRAFPTIYAHRDVDCFMTEPGAYKFPRPIWYRKPAALSRPPQPQIDMNDFILEFNQKLHLRALESKIPRSQLSQRWCAGRYIPWCPAPHPALIRSTRVSSIYPPVERSTTIPATTHYPHAFRSPSPSTLSTTFVPSQTRSATSPRRKVASLPRRTPKYKSIAHLRESSAVSEASLEPTCSPSSSSSCMSSFGSTISSRRASSSSSSSSSSTPTTPVLSSSLLPGDNGSSAVSVSGVDFDYTDDPVDNASKITSPVEESLAFLGVTQSKQRFVFGFDTPAAHLSRNHLHWMPSSQS